ncbi:helix-turn-helix domain-containing protein [Mammaliicoccus sciuri]|uniref:helix-turn-helix domain-containing protein n=4 Tax=Mammaliicoccus sciuri TaxID=1296 RepID=UPI0019532124|nr:helix-turn-helix domain-containing protein [Mammaliicoccus sciuri]
MRKKYDFKFKIKLVKEYLEGHQSYRTIALKYGVSSWSVLRIWVNQYKEFGEEGLEIKSRNTVYTSEFKLSVLKFRQENMLSYQDTANHFRIINPIIIANWQHQFDEKCRLDIDKKQKGRSHTMTKKRSKSDNKNLPLNENEHEELERLRNENETLKAGIAYQKKLQALTDIYGSKNQK